ncbi:hypothetical protein F5B20DRAFT_536422 [Whalleya microplaca]|nr:hypothetical protein F5B20DRAFT_536422 [Whalleya microplaca]
MKTDIWIHLRGSILFVVPGPRALASRCLSLSTGANFAFDSFTSTVACLELSTMSRTLRSHPYRAQHSSWAGRMSLESIHWLFVVGISSMTYYTFFCNPEAQHACCALDLFAFAALLGDSMDISFCRS